jgi:hypothetical protein
MENDSTPLAVNAITPLWDTIGALDDEIPHDCNCAGIVRVRPGWEHRSRCGEQCRLEDVFDRDELRQLVELHEREKFDQLE